MSGNVIREKPGKLHIEIILNHVSFRKDILKMKKVTPCEERK
jgi:hypothetical protein